MRQNNAIYTVLRKTGLFHEYNRMAALDPRVPALMQKLLPHASYYAPGDKEPLLIKTLRDATGVARWHFRHSDPGDAAALARAAYLEALQQLTETLTPKGENDGKTIQ